MHFHEKKHGKRQLAVARIPEPVSAKNSLNIDGPFAAIVEIAVAQHLADDPLLLPCCASQSSGWMVSLHWRRVSDVAGPRKTGAAGRRYPPCCIWRMVAATIAAMRSDSCAELDFPNPRISSACRTAGTLP